MLIASLPRLIVNLLNLFRPVSAASSSSLECSTCKKFYPNIGDYWDMTVAVGSTEYSESTTVTTEVFR